MKSQPDKHAEKEENDCTTSAMGGVHLPPHWTHTTEESHKTQEMLVSWVDLKKCKMSTTHLYRVFCVSSNILMCPKNTLIHQ
jgi:hypothetical protein